MDGIDKSRPRIFRSIIQTVFKNSRTNHEGRHVSLTIEACRPVVEQAAGQVRDRFIGFKITPIDRYRLYPEFAHQESLH